MYLGRRDTGIATSQYKKNINVHHGTPSFKINFSAAIYYSLEGSNSYIVIANLTKLLMQQSKSLHIENNTRRNRISTGPRR